MDFQIRGKVALVTAASQGIGKATAELLLQEGCKVAICSRNRDNLMKAVDEMKSSYGIEPYWSVCNINYEKDIVMTMDAVVKNLGPVDILVNNCGGPVTGTFDELTEDDWNNAHNQVLLSAIRFTRRALPTMKERRWGRIINITSVAVKEPSENLMLSNAIRTGLIGFAKSLSNEIGKYNITVNNVAPGFTLTKRLYEIAVDKAKNSGESHEKVLSNMGSSVPLKRLGKPEDIAAAAVFFASQQAGYITGTTLQVDGGKIKSLF